MIGNESSCEHRGVLKGADMGYGALAVAKFQPVIFVEPV
jgi:hypothetical protein